MAVTFAGSKGVEQFEVHSELALVCPEVRGAALELLGRDEGSLRFRSEPVSRTRQPARQSPRLLLALAAYVGQTVWQTAILALIATVALVAVVSGLELAGR